MPAVSVIMPLYNSARFLPRAVESVLNQSFVDFELILVNDGSTDASPEICGKYASLDSRVTVLHQPNAGMSAARNRGLETAEGEYAAFIDSDDEYLPGLLEKNYALALESGADVVKFGFTRCHIGQDKKRMSAWRVPKPPGTYDRERIIENYPRLHRSGVFTYVWDAFYKRNLITENNIRFDSRVKVYNDICFNYDCLPYIRKLALNPDIHYLYFVREGQSVSTKHDTSRTESYVVLSGKEYRLFSRLDMERVHHGYWKKTAAGYLAMIMFDVFDQRNPSDYLQKTAFLESLREREQFGFIDESGWPRLMSRTGKYGVFAALFKLRCYRLLKLIIEYPKIRKTLLKIIRSFSKLWD